MSRPSSGGASVDLTTLESKLDTINGKIPANNDAEGREITRQYISDSLLNTGINNVQLDVDKNRFTVSSDDFKTDTISGNSTNALHVLQSEGLYRPSIEPADMIDDMFYNSGALVEQVWSETSNQLTTNSGSGYTITSSGVTNVANINDGNISTYASSTDINGWIKWDGGGSVDVNGMSIHSQTGNHQYQPRGVLKVEGSHNDIDWTTIWEADLTDVTINYFGNMKGALPNRLQGDVWMIPWYYSSTNYRYWRFSWTQLGTAGSIRLYRVELNGNDNHSYRASTEIAPITGSSTQVAKFQFGNSIPANDEPAEYQRYYGTTLDWSGKDKIRCWAKTDIQYNWTLKVYDRIGNLIVSTSANLRPSANDVWEEIEIDLSGIIDANKSNINCIRITANNSSAIDGSAISICNLHVVDSTTTQNLTLVSNDTLSTAGQQISNANVTMHVDAIDAFTLNTDFVASVSCNGGANWEQVTLVDKGIVTNKGRQYAGGIQSITNPGTSIKWKIETSNNKNLSIHGVGLFFDQASLEGAANNAALKFVQQTITETAWTTVVDVASGSGKLFFILFDGNTATESIAELRLWIDSANYIEMDLIDCVRYDSVYGIHGTLLPFGGHVYNSNLRIDVKMFTSGYSTRLKICYSS